MWANMYLWVRSMSQCLLLPFRCGMWWYIFFSLSVSQFSCSCVTDVFGARRGAGVLPEPSITLCSIPRQLLSHGPASSVFVRLCSRSSLRDGAVLTTGSFLFLEGLFRWHLWDSGHLLALGRRQQCVTFGVCNQRGWSSCSPALNGEVWLAPDRHRCGALQKLECETIALTGES